MILLGSRPGFQTGGEISVVGMDDLDDLNGGFRPFFQMRSRGKPNGEFPIVGMEKGTMVFWSSVSKGLDIF